MKKKIVSVLTRKIISVLSKELDSDFNIGCISKDMKNYIRNTRRKLLEEKCTKVV